MKVSKSPHQFLWTGVRIFTRIATDTLKCEITIYDPTTWTKLWTASLRLKQTQGDV